MRRWALVRWRASPSRSANRRSSRSTHASATLVLDNLEPNRAHHDACDFLIMRAAAAGANPADEDVTLLHREPARQRRQFEIAPLIECAFALFEIALEAQRVPAHERRGVRLADRVAQDARVCAVHARRCDHLRTNIGNRKSHRPIELGRGFDSGSDHFFGLDEPKAQQFPHIASCSSTLMRISGWARTYRPNTLIKIAYRLLSRLLQGNGEP